MKKETPCASESCTRTLVQSESGGRVNCSAHTGAPILAMTIVMPAERSKVLLPDIFEPVTSKKVPCGPIWTSFVTR